MSQTHRAKLAPYRNTPLKQEYLERVDRLRDLPVNERRKIPMYETMCPYCGFEGALRGTVKVGAKKVVSNVILAREGFTIPNVGKRTTELVMIDCAKKLGGCGRAVDPKAYSSPIWFVGDRTSGRDLVDRFLASIGQAS